jgi:hypothetical protein
MGDAVRLILLLAWKQPNDKLLKSLKDDSDVLEQQISAFSSVSKNMPLVCVYEELPMQVRKFGRSWVYEDRSADQNTFV